MKTHSSRVTPFEVFTEEDVRDYAYHLYIQSGRLPGHELDNWLEAKACLAACIPPSGSHTRLHQHTQKTAAQVAPADRTFAA